MTREDQQVEVVREPDVIEAEEPIKQQARRVALRSADGFLAFGLGSGLLTRAPGTMGTLVAVPIWIAVSLLGISHFWFLLATFLAGVWLCGRVARALGLEDYGGIVWDEMVGYWFVMSFLPLGWAWMVAAFVLFRSFDILKPWPISLLEREFSGGFGIMIDDIGAAIYAVIVLKFIHHMLQG